MRSQHTGSSTTRLVPLQGALEQKASEITEGLKKIQFKAAVALYTQLRENILRGDFPIDLFEHHQQRSLPRLVKNAEQEASVLSISSEQLKRNWENGTGLVRPITEGKLIWAALEIKEIKEDLTKINPDTVFKINDDLSRALYHSYRPKALLEVWYSEWGVTLMLIATVLTAVIMPVLMLRTPGFSVYRRASWGLLLVSTAMVIIGLYSALILAGPSLFGPHTLVRQSRELIADIEKYAVVFSDGHERIEMAVNYFEEYCSVRMGLNETLSATINEFNVKMNEIYTSDSKDSTTAVTTRPEMVLAIVESTKKTLREQKMALLELSVSRKKHSPNSKVSLKDLISLVDDVETLFSQLEINIYANLRVGRQTTEVITNHLTTLLTLVDDGKLQDCVQFYDALRTHQLLQMNRLKEANNHVKAVNDKVSELRLENTRLQPHFTSEQFISFIGKWASRAGMVTASAPLISMLALPAAATAPAMAVGVAVAAIGYRWQALYENAEGDAKQIVEKLIGLDMVLQKVESGLSSHEVTLANLFKAVELVVTSIERSDRRFKAVMLGRVYTDEEVTQLKNSVNRVLESVSNARERYGTAENALYMRIKERYQSGSMATTPPAVLSSTLVENN